MDNIIVGVMTVIVVGAGIFCWWMSRDTGDDDEKEGDKK